MNITTASFFKLATATGLLASCSKAPDAPVTADVIFSENGVIQPFGEASWLTMDKRGAYWLPVTDEAAGQAAVLTVMYERGDWELTTRRENGTITA